MGYLYFLNHDMTPQSFSIKTNQLKPNLLEKSTFECSPARSELPKWKKLLYNMHFDFLIWPSADVDGRVYDLSTIFINYNALSTLIGTGGPKLASYLR